MRRKPLFLAATAAELLRFFALSFVAAAFGKAAEGQGDAALLRYASAPGLLFGAAFFFLWRDPLRYAPYRSLIVAGKILSLAAFVPLGMTLLASLYPGWTSLDLRAALPWALALPGVDLLSLAIAALSGRETPSRPAEPERAEFISRSLGAGREEARAPAQAGTPAPAGPAGTARPSGPRGPEDIEGVEA